MKNKTKTKKIVKQINKDYKNGKGISWADINILCREQFGYKNGLEDLVEKIKSKDIKE